MQIMNRSVGLAWGLRSEFLTCSQVMPLFLCQTTLRAVRPPRRLSHISVCITGLLKLRLLDPLPKFVSQLSGTGPGSCMSSKCPNDTNSWGPHFDNHCLRWDFPTEFSCKFSEGQVAWFYCTLFCFLVLLYCCSISVSKRLGGFKALSILQIAEE